MTFISIRVLKIIYSRTCKIRICVQKSKVQKDMDTWTWEIGNDVLMNLILRQDNLSATTCWWTLFWGRIISVRIWIQPWAQRSHQKQQGHVRELTIRRKWPEWLYWKKCCTCVNKSRQEQKKSEKTKKSTRVSWVIMCKNIVHMRCYTVLSMLFRR